MSRTPPPPGPPPAHYRPPGTPRPSALPPRALSPTPAPSGPSGIGPGAATAVALVTMLVGVLLGFFLGRTYESSSNDDSRSAPLTLPPTSSTTRPPGDTIPQTAPTPSTTTPPGTELDPATIGSFDDPIPVGQAYVLGLYELEVLDADLDAAPELAAFDPTNPAPPADHHHVLVEVAVRASGFGSPASIPFFVSDGSGQWFAFDSSCGRIPDDLANSGFVDEGDEVTGQVCFTVPTDAVDSLVFGTEGISSPLYFALPDR